MDHNENKRSAQHIGRIIGTCLLCLLVGIAFSCFFAASWYVRVYGRIGFDSVLYTLTGKDGLRSRVMQLNGRDLVLGENDELPCLCGAEVAAGEIQLPAESCSFIVL